MKTIDGTIIIMNDGEKIFLKFTKDQINNAIDEALSIGKNYITIDYLDRDIYFKYIKDKYSKTRYLSLPEPKQQVRTPEQLKQDRKKLEAIHKKFLEENADYRINAFINKRKTILEKLAREEKSFNLETTLSKVDKYLKSQL